MLPSHESRRTNGIGSIHVVNWTVVASLCWLLASLGAVYYGFRVNSLSYYSYELKCDHYQCQYIKNDDYDKRIEFERWQIRFIDVVKMKGDEIIATLPSNGEWREFSVAVTLFGILHDPHNPPPPFVVRPNTHSVARCNMEKRKIEAYRSHKTSDLHLKSSASVTVFGIMLILCGTASAILSVIVGQWSDPTPKRLKKLS